MIATKEELKRFQDFLGFNKKPKAKTKTKRKNNKRKK